MNEELKEGIPAVMTHCFNGHEALYELPQVTDFGESICHICREIFWSTNLMNLAHIRREIRLGLKRKGQMKTRKDSIARDTGLNLEDESWTWDDLARELTGKYKISDLSELVFMLEQHESGILADLLAKVKITL